LSRLADWLVMTETISSLRGRSRPPAAHHRAEGLAGARSVRMLQRLEVMRLKK